MIRFPPLEYADETGLLAVGGELNAETLLQAYSNGIFPWPIANFPEVPWFAPPERAVLFFDRLHVSRSMQRFCRKHSYRLLFNKNFRAVITACAQVPRKQKGSGNVASWTSDSWITGAMIEAYCELHELGHASSVECYRGDDLVAGLYGVTIGGFFAGESMFSLESNTSKLCLLHLVEHLQQQGAGWIDCQQASPLLEQFGVQLVARSEFMQLLADALASRAFQF